MELSTDKIEELQHIVELELSTAPLTNCIDDAIASCAGDTVAEEQILDKLKKKGLIEEILDHLQSKVSSPEPSPAPKHHVPVDTNGCIYLQILHGKAFLEHLENSQSISESFFKIHIHFRNQRFQSKCVPVSCEPNFSQGFLFKLSTPSGSCCRDSMLSICDPMHIVLVRYDADGECALVSSHSLEWRFILADDHCSSVKAIEMMGIGSECKVHAGILEIQLQLLPDKLISMPKKVIDAQLHLEKQRCCERERLFLNYAKQWWKEFIQLRDEHKDRPVKIFAQDETGVNRVVCGYVQPLHGSRLINSPKEAARFVSAFHCEKSSSIGTGTKVDQWQSLHSFLCTKKGDHEDHSNLLCSLLLGFGLDAYVCIGLKTNNTLYSWVVVRHCDDSLVYFWDAVSGRRYPHHRIEPNDPPAVQQPVCTYPFKIVGCLYNHNSFYANVQPLPDARTVGFTLENRNLWKSMNVESISSVNGDLHPNFCIPLPPLMPPSMDGASIEEKLEQSVKLLICQHRKDIEICTQWDDNLSYLLGQSLAAYEAEKLYGVANIGNDDFKDAIKRAVPDGDTFKGFPIQFLHHDVCRVFKACMKSEICRTIIECRGDGARLALRSHVTVFPDDVIVVWLMVACRYRCIL